MEGYTYFVSYSHASRLHGTGFGSTSVVLAEPVTDWQGIEALTAGAIENNAGRLPGAAIVIVNFILLSGPEEG